MKILKTKKDVLKIDTIDLFKKSVSEFISRPDSYLFSLLIFCVFASLLSLLPMIIFPEGFAIFHATDPLFSLMGLLENKSAIQPLIDKDKTFMIVSFFTSSLIYLMFISYICFIVSNRIERKTYYWYSIVIPSKKTFKFIGRFIFLMLICLVPIFIVRAIVGDVDLNITDQQIASSLQNNTIDGEVAVVYLLFPLCFYWFLSNFSLSLPAVFSASLDNDRLTVLKSRKIYAGNFMKIFFTLVLIYFLSRSLPSFLVNYSYNAIFGEIQYKSMMSAQIIVVHYFVSQFVNNFFYLMLALFFF